MNKRQYSVPLLLLLSLVGILVLGITTQTQARGVNIANTNIEAGIDAPAASGGATATTEIEVHRAQNTVSRTYTLDADFDEGNMINVNHDAPNNDQL